MSARGPVDDTRNLQLTALRLQPPCEAVVYQMSNTDIEMNTACRGP